MRLFLVSDKVDPVIGMRLAGVEGVCLREPERLAEALETAAGTADIGVLLYTAGVRESCPQRQNRPLLLEIPDGESASGNSGSITEYIQEAVGIHL